MGWVTKKEQKARDMRGDPKHTGRKIDDPKAPRARVDGRSVADMEKGKDCRECGNSGFVWKGNTQKRCKSC